MKPNKKHLLKIILSALLLIAMQGCSSHANYPVTRMAGWAFAQHAPWETLELSAKFENQNFSLYNSTTHLLIKARVKAQGHGTVTYRIKKLHISQRTVQEDLQKVMDIKITAPGFPPKPSDLFIKQYQQKYRMDTLPFTVIEITPIFEANPFLRRAETREFDLIIEEPIQNRAPGRNYYRITLGDRHIDLGTFQ
jgi:uncharacterized protein YcfL